jgi:hypothetical protein
VEARSYANFSFAIIPDRRFFVVSAARSAVLSAAIAIYWLSCSVFAPRVYTLVPRGFASACLHESARLLFLSQGGAVAIFGYCS